MNKMNCSLALIILALFGLSQTGLAQGNLVLNGGFDTSSNGIVPDYWTLTGSGHQNPLKGNPAPSFIFDTSGGTLSQNIYDLSPGSNYIVSGNYGGKGLASYGFGVALDGVIFFETNSPQTTAWYDFSFDYTATSSSVVLGVLQFDTGSNYQIDNISMQPIPEPSVASFILFSSGVLIYARSQYCRKRFRFQP